MRDYNVAKLQRCSFIALKLYYRILELTRSFVYTKSYHRNDFSDDLVYDDVTWFIDRRVEETVKRSVNVSIFDSLKLGKLNETLCSSDRFEVTSRILEELK
jgi:hypothetical protein